MTRKIKLTVNNSINTRVCWQSFTSMRPGLEKTAVFSELFLCNGRCPELVVPPTTDRLVPKLHCIAPIGQGFTPGRATGARLLYAVPIGNVLPQLKNMNSQIRVNLMYVSNHET